MKNYKNKRGSSAPRRNCYIQKQPTVEIPAGDYYRLVSESTMFQVLARYLVATVDTYANVDTLRLMIGLPERKGGTL